MTWLQMFGQVAAGLRLGLVLLAVMSLLARYRASPEPTPADRYKSRAWTLLAAAILTYSPAHAASLLGRAAPEIASRALDALGTAMCCASLIYLLAARGLLRGLTPERVRRGMAMNLAVVLATVGAAWLTR